MASDHLVVGYAIHRSLTSGVTRAKRTMRSGDCTHSERGGPAVGPARTPRRRPRSRGDTRRAMSQENVEIVRAVWRPSTAGTSRRRSRCHDTRRLSKRRSERASIQAASGVARRSGQAIRRVEGTFEDYRSSSSSEFIDRRRVVVVRVAGARGRQRGRESDCAVALVSSSAMAARSCVGDIRDGGRGPRSRGAVGVGDVAGERGAVAGVRRSGRPCSCGR